MNELWPVVQAERTDKAQSRAAGCNNICHNYPENINITAPGSAGLPGQFCCVLLVCSLAGSATVTPRSGHDMACQKHQVVPLCLWGPPHQLSQCIFNALETFSILKRQHHEAVGVVGARDQKNSPSVCESLSFKVWTCIWVILTFNPDYFTCWFKCHNISVVIKTPKAEWAQSHRVINLSSETLLISTAIELNCFIVNVAVLKHSTFGHKEQ